MQTDLDLLLNPASTSISELSLLSSSKLKLAVVVSTRYEIIRLSRIIYLAEKYFDLVLIHIGQNYDVKIRNVFFDQMGIKCPDINLDVVGNNLGSTIGNIVSKSFDLFLQVKPDCLLILGSTNSALCAISAKSLKIPIFHIKSKKCYFNENVSKEMNEKIIDHISDFNLCYCKNSRKQLLSEGCNPDRTVVIDTPFTEVVHFYKKDIDKSTILQEFNLQAKNYFVLSLHREENIGDENITNLIDCINSIAEIFNKHVIFSTHPRTRIRLNEHILNRLIKVINPPEFFDYYELQRNAYCVLSDSISVVEECVILNFPAILIHNSTEIPQVVDSDNIIAGEINHNIINCIKIAVELFDTVLTQQCESVSTKIIKIIQAYTPIIKKLLK